MGLFKPNESIAFKDPGYTNYWTAPNISTGQSFDEMNQNIQNKLAFRFMNIADFVIHVNYREYIDEDPNALPNPILNNTYRGVSSNISCLQTSQFIPNYEIHGNNWGNSPYATRHKAYQDASLQLFKPLVVIPLFSLENNHDWSTVVPHPGRMQGHWINQDRTCRTLNIHDEIFYEQYNINTNAQDPTLFWIRRFPLQPGRVIYSGTGYFSEDNYKQLHEFPTSNPMPSSPTRFKQNDEQSVWWPLIR